MALSHELPIYKDTYKLILIIFEQTKHFSREYKYTLGQKHPEKQNTKTAK